MLLLLKLVELFILIVVIKMLIGVIFPGSKRKAPFAGKDAQNNRFDSKDADISDGEYKEIR